GRRWEGTWQGLRLGQGKDRRGQPEGGTLIWLGVVNDLEPGYISREQPCGHMLNGYGQNRLSELRGVFALCAAGLRVSRSPGHEGEDSVAGPELTENLVPPRPAADQITILWGSIT